MNFRRDILLCCKRKKCNLLRDINRLKNQNKRLKELVVIDPMTGLFNVRHFFSLLEKEMEKTRRTGVTTSLIIMDVDHFKAINDKFGHLVGDTVLKNIAKIIKLSVRTTDTVCRYGGEEFAVILSQTLLKDAIGVAERIRKTLEKADIRNDDQTIKVTASFGVSHFLPYEKLTPEAFVDSVDQLLLQAKRSGRNKVVWSKEALLEEGLSLDERRALLLP